MQRDSKKTIVRGIRASQNFWDNCDKVAEQEQKTRNDLIVKVVSKYCEKSIDTEKKV